ncbi:Ger(x)C family spore germination protein [Paenibacillus sp. DMB20]|uniref:Ger(x)C family spore germination protein n=1 Tax=Paenibacillus sp. DMB20 TaxID=1642570 RepID=UPI0006277381|nr:Ger(x)C family spore germination protein [Paenibacillus sp. DMB20]KKO52456.1 hypothetical protein XI25_19960 [Paenibacillus sp. DMB20]
MKAVFCLLSMILAAVFLAGCWDREYLKDLNLAYSVGFDLTEEMKMQETVEIIFPPEAEQMSTINEIYTCTGQTPRDASNRIRNKVRGNIRFIKNGIRLIGKPLAEHGIYSTLNVNFRDPSNPTSNVRVIITDQKASDILFMQKVGELKIGEFITQKIKSLEEMSLFYPPETVDSLFRSLKDPGQDFALPYIGQEGKDLAAKGVALFHNEHYTGLLNTDQAIMLTLLKGGSGDNARFTKKIEMKDPNPILGSISFNVGQKKIRRSFKVKVSPQGDIDVYLGIKLHAIIEEYTGQHLLTEKNINSMNKKLSEMLTEQAEEVIRKVQEANCDIFGVGRHLIAYHNKIWRSKNWSTDYKEVRFHAKVDLNIVDTGVLR